MHSAADAVGHERLLLNCNTVASHQYSEITDHRVQFIHACNSSNSVTELPRALGNHRSNFDRLQLGQKF